MSKHTGSKDSASKHSLNPTGDFQGKREPQAEDQAEQGGDPPQHSRETGQFTGPGTPALEKR